MDAHILAEDGTIINTIVVDSLDVFPDMTLVDASNGGSIGDKIVDGVVIAKSTAPTVKDYMDAVQAQLDAAAQAKNYDDIVSACSYAGAPNPFQAEAQKFLAWRGNVWAACYQIMDDVESRKRTAPTVGGLLSELPELSL